VLAVRQHDAARAGVALIEIAARRRPCRARHFYSSTYPPPAWLPRCGHMQVPQPEKLIVPIQRGPCAMGRCTPPGFSPMAICASRSTGGHDTVQALAQRYGFDPATTPWDEMTPQAQHAFVWRSQPHEGPLRQPYGRTPTCGAALPGSMAGFATGTWVNLYANAALVHLRGRRLRAEYLVVL